MKSEYLERRFNNMYKIDISNLKYALGILGPILDTENSNSGSQLEPTIGDISMETNKDHFCKAVSRRVKMYKRIHKLGSDGKVTHETWQHIMSKNLSIQIV